MEGLFATYLFALLISAVIIGYLTRAVAKDKGHDATPWFWGGFLLGPLGLLAAVGLSDRRLRNYIRQIGESQGAIKEEIKSLSSSTDQTKTLKITNTADEDEIWETLMFLLSEKNLALADKSKSKFISSKTDPRYSICRKDSMEIAKGNVVDPYAEKWEWRVVEF